MKNPNVQEICNETFKEIKYLEAARKMNKKICQNNYLFRTCSDHTNYNAFTNEKQIETIYDKLIL